jgi:hypothetical protein
LFLNKVALIQGITLLPSAILNTYFAAFALQLYRNVLMPASGADLIAEAKRLAVGN